jgi:hypothetical protein
MFPNYHTRRRGTPSLVRTCSVLSPPLPHTSVTRDVHTFTLGTPCIMHHGSNEASVRLHFCQVGVKPYPVCYLFRFGRRIVLSSPIITSPRMLIDVSKVF